MSSMSHAFPEDYERRTEASISAGDDDRDREPLNAHHEGDSE